MSSSGGYQHVNPYNVHLPRPADTEDSSDLLLASIRDELRDCIAREDLRQGVCTAINHLGKYHILYGMKYSLEDHLLFLRAAYQLMITPNLYVLNLDKACKTFMHLAKKKHLIGE